MRAARQQKERVGEDLVPAGLRRHFAAGDPGVEGRLPCYAVTGRGFDLTYLVDAHTQDQRRDLSSSLLVLEILEELVKLDSEADHVVKYQERRVKRAFRARRSALFQLWSRLPHKTRYNALPSEKKRANRKVSAIQTRLLV